MRGHWIAAFCTIFIASPALADEQDFTVSGIEVVAWLPKTLDHAPVIFFSHGARGCADAATFLMDDLADAGYAVFAPEHTDSSCGTLRKPEARPPVSFRDGVGWNDTDYASRAKDIETLLAALPKEARFAKLDWKNIGLSGHSLGGYTVLELAGGWPKWKDDRVKAVLAMAPYTAAFIDQSTLGDIQIPVMYQVGTEDSGMTPPVKKDGGAYDQTGGPKYYIEIEGAQHVSFNDADDTGHDVMTAYAVAFFDAYLKGKPFPAALLKKHGGVAELKSDGGE